MEILEIRMDHFGKFHGQSMMFHPGINVVCGDNEAGKSTMAAFLRAMLYGVEKQRGRASRTDEYARRAPWDGGGFSGRLRFAAAGKTYCLERNFSRNEKSARLYCETDGAELPAEGGGLSGLLQETDQRVFDNTVFFGRSSARTQEELAAAVVNEMIGRGADGEHLDAVGALRSLRSEQKKLEKERKERIAKQAVRMQELATRIDCARQEADQLAREEQEFRSELELLPGAKENKESFLETEGESRHPVSGFLIGKVAMAILGVGALAAGLLAADSGIRAGAAAVILLSCIGMTFFGKKDAGRQEELRRQRERERWERAKGPGRREQGEAQKRERLLLNLEWLREARREKNVQIRELEAQREASGQEGELEELDQKLSALALALETLEASVAEIYREDVQGLNKEASKILAEITGGRYTAIFLDEEFQVRVKTPERLLSLWQVSRGTAEQVYFALRMACTGFLNAEEPLPLILDDAFLAYDDARLERVLRWLYRSGRQVLLFTCQKREQELLQKICGEC